MSDTDPASNHPKQIGRSHLNRSRYPISDQPLPGELSDPPLKEVHMLPSVKTGLFKVAQTLNFSLRRDFGQSARPLVRLRLGAD